MFILIGFAFLAGIVTVLSPCILPVLPIVLSGGVASGKRRPLGIITGFIISFTFFTLFLSTLVRLIGVPANVLRVASVIIVGVFGFSLVFPQLQAYIERAFQKLTALAPTKPGSDYFSGVVVGLSLGLLWTPCVGPILASVISVALTGSISSAAFFITLAYALGTAIPLFVIMYGGQELFKKHPALLHHSQRIQQVFGVLMIVTAVAISQNWDRQFQNWVLTTFPKYGTGLTSLEDNRLVNQQLSQLSQTEVDREDMGQPTYKLAGADGTLPILFAAPDLKPTGEWFNSEPLSLEELRGQVVLIDFWTYSCINCIRTLPYLKDWYQQYHDQGFEIIGVHSPEFEFEKDAKNVQAAIDDFELPYPVMQDNQFLTWRAYNNRYWPAKYLIDQKGNVRYTHFGEGDYQETENAIRQLLGEEPVSQNENQGDDKQQSTTWPNRQQTPETYLGYQRAESYVNQNIQIDQTKTYDSPTDIPLHGVSLSGEWFVGPEYIQAQQNKAQLQLHFNAAQVYVVMELAKGVETGIVEVELDGQPLEDEYMTTDFNEVGMIEIHASRKYDLLNLENAQQHQLTLTFSPGVRAFAFTFGS